MDEFYVPGKLATSGRSVWVGPHVGWGFPFELDHTNICERVSPGSPRLPAALAARFPAVAARLAGLGMRAGREVLVGHNRTSDALIIEGAQGALQVLTAELEPEFVDAAHRVGSAFTVDRILRAGCGSWCRTHAFSPLYDLVLYSPLRDLEDMPSVLEEWHLDVLEADGAIAFLEEMEAKLQPKLEAATPLLAPADAAIDAMRGNTVDGVYDLPLLGRTQRLTFPGFTIGGGRAGMQVKVPPEVVWLRLGGDSAFPETPRYVAPPRSWWRQMLGL